MKKWMIYVLFALVTLFFLFPLLPALTNLGIQDWDQHFFYNAVPRTTILNYQQIPLWNPYHNGGAPLLGNPQSRFLSPTFLLILIFGEVIGLKLEAMFFLWLGLIGTFLWARYNQLQTGPSVLTSILYMCSGIFSTVVAHGMTVFFSIALIPWVFLFFQKSIKHKTHSKTHILSTAIILTWIFFIGGPHPIIVIGVGLVLFSIFTQGKKNLRKLVIILLLTVALSAVKLIPTTQLLLTHPRPTSEFTGYSVESLYHSLTSRSQATFPFETQGNFLKGYSSNMDENSLYIGVIPLILGTIGLALSFNNKKLRPKIFMVLTLLAIMFGDRITPSIWKALHFLPIFNSLQTPERFKWVFLLFFAFFVGLAVQKILKHIRVKHIILTIFTLIVFIDLALVSAAVLEPALNIPDNFPKINQPFSQVLYSSSYNQNGFSQNRWDLANAWDSTYVSFRKNIGTINAYEPLNLPRHALPRDHHNYRGENFVYGTLAPTKTIFWSPNKVTISTKLKEPGYVVLNQNFYPGWQTNRGPAESLFNLLSIQLPPGEHSVTFSYKPSSFTFGLWVSILSFIGSIYYVRKHNIRKHKKAQAEENK